MQLSQRIKQMLERGGPVLLVLDDLWSEYQLRQLLPSGTCLPKGSQLLLTSRRKDVVADYNPAPMELLSDAYALPLLTWHACGHTSPPVGFEEVAMDAMRRCGGLPLALKVLGGAFQREPATPGAWRVSSHPVRGDEL